MKSHARLVLAAALAALGLVSASALATAGTSDSSPTAQTSTAQSGKVTICHKGKNTLSISVNAWPAHKAHGDTLGSCANAKQKGPKKHEGTTTTTTTTTTASAPSHGNGHGSGKNK